MFNIFSQTIQMPDGQIITLETGKLARQADGSVVLKSGNLVMLATVCANKEHKEGTDFLPLSVDYQEKFASSGKNPGSFQRREGKLSDNEVLISRLIDRALRPIFPENFHDNERVFFSLKEGIFVNSNEFSSEVLNRQESLFLKQILSSNLSNLYEIETSRDIRKNVLDALIRYYQFHLHQFPELNSNRILGEIF
jgi:hypothetical protein